MNKPESIWIIKQPNTNLIEGKLKKITKQN